MSPVAGRATVTIGACSVDVLLGVMYASGSLIRNYIVLGCQLFVSGFPVRDGASSCWVV
jgi:hypothetical protein